MKLVVQIPCFNEEATIAKVINSVPRKIPKISQVKILIIDDGSTDQTAAVAKTAGADLVIRNPANLGLAKTFRLALKKSLEMGADIIVNTDGDNQYDQKEIPKLLAPLLEKTADMVIGDRQVGKLDHMPQNKKMGNLVGSWMIRFLTGAKIRDASSGFRAFNKKAAKNFHLFSAHTYTHETIIQAVYSDLTLAEIPITFKRRTAGQSRLIQGVWKHIKYCSATIIRTLLMYKAFKYLVTAGMIVIAAGFLTTLRFGYFFVTGEGKGHVQSLIIASVLIGVGFNTILLGIIADLISINRKIMEKR